jgi:two-component system response regulator HydG
VKPRILIADDDAGVRYTLREVLASEDVDVVEAKDGVEALNKAQAEPFDLVLTDLRMPRMDGIALLRAILALPDAPPVILLTAHGNERTAVEAMKLGAWDYFRKPFEIDEVVAVVRRALETTRLRADRERLTSALALSKSLLFASPAMERLAVWVRRVAPKDVTVLITGPTGSGKERVAESLVRASKRADKPFVRFNCAAIAPELAEAELFGHTKGAFTGAQKERPGLFREAHGGTVLLDEIGELDLNLQAKLLRVLQEGEVRPVGEDRTLKVDVRVLAATHRDLKALVAEGKFREDLLWRLDVVRLEVPALKDRPEDIALLARHFLERYARRFGMARLDLDEALLQRLQGYDWPGNVRELEHAIERMVALSDEGGLDADLLPSPGAASATLDLKSRVEAYERRLVMEALEAARGNRTEAAKALGIGRVTLYEKLARYGVGGKADGG